MALIDQPFIPSTAKSTLTRKLHTYCSPLDTFAKGILENRRVEPIRQSLHEYRVQADLHNQLPPDVPAFAGRLDELRAIAQHLTPAPAAPMAATAAFVVSGKSGVGKTALAVHAAYQLRSFYPDAQLYVDLHGSDSQMLSLDAAIAHLLRAWHEYDGWLPTTLEERLSLYQQVLVDKRILIILDDFSDLTQLEPLIPKAQHCAVLITSRHPVAGLAIAKQLTLTTMTEDEGLDLLSKTTIGDRDSVAALDAAAAKQIVNLCDCLPLAIQIAARSLPDRSSQVLLDYSSRLAVERNQLASFNSSDLAVRATFALAYQELSEGCQALFKRLSLSPQPVLTDSMAQMLFAADQDSAAAGIADLLKRQLIRKIDSHRYAFQPLLRLMAREKLAQTESPQQRQAIRTDITHWYLQRAETMALLFHPTTRSQLFPRLTEGSRALHLMSEQDLRLSALQWFDTEYANLMACINWAHQAQAWHVVTQFAKHLVIFAPHGAHRQDWEHSHQMGLESAQRLGNRQLEAQIANNLGNIYLRQGQWNEAKTYYEVSLACFQALSDKEHEAHTLENLAILQDCRQTGDVSGKLSDRVTTTWSANIPASSTSADPNVRASSAIQPSSQIGARPRSLAPTNSETYIVVIVGVVAIALITLVLILI